MILVLLSGNINRKSLCESDVFYTLKIYFDRNNEVKDNKEVLNLAHWAYAHLDTLAKALLNEEN